MKTIGIIGGMGPEATLDLFRKIIANTPAGKDQEHLPVLIDNNPQVPDRTQYLLGGGEDPLPHLIKSAVRLEKSGAEALCMPCNTAHYFIEALQKEVEIPFISIVDATFRAMRLMDPSIQRVGLLATAGTVETGIYHKVFEQGGIELLDLKKSAQDGMMEIIYGVKAGGIEKQVDSFREKVEELVAKGAEAIIAGCTEIPLLLEYLESKVKFFDPTLILAKELVAFGYSDGLNN